MFFFITQKKKGWNSIELFNDDKCLSMIELPDEEGVITVSSYIYGQNSGGDIYKYDHERRTRNLANDRYRFSGLLLKGDSLYAQNIDHSGGGNGIYLSEDKGDTWKKIISTSYYFPENENYIISEELGKEYFVNTIYDSYDSSTFLQYSALVNGSVICTYDHNVFNYVNKIKPGNDGDKFICSDAGLYKLPGVKGGLSFYPRERDFVKVYRIAEIRNEDEGGRDTSIVYMKEEWHDIYLDNGTATYTIKFDYLKPFFVSPQRSEVIMTHDMHNDHQNVYGYTEIFDGNVKYLIDSLNASVGDIYNSVLADFIPGRNVKYEKNIIYGSSVPGKLFTKVVSTFEYYEQPSVYHITERLGLTKHNFTGIRSNIQVRYEKNLVCYEDLNGRLLGNEYYFEDVNVDTTWPESVKIVKDIEINGVTHIEPGTVISVHDSTGIVINNDFYAVGTPEKPIIFENLESGKWKGIRINNADVAVFRYCIFRNINNPDGGAIEGNNGVQLTIADCIEEGCDGEEGALYINGSSAEISDLLINNCCSEASAGAININNSSVDIINSTIADNKAKISGGGISITDSDLGIINSIIWNNYSPDGLQVESSGSSNLDINTCLIMDGINGIGIGKESKFSCYNIINEQPMFNLSFKGYRYSLSEKSPCIDAGITLDSNYDVSEYDLAGMPRINGDGLDLGAYEYYVNGIDDEESDSEPKATLLQNYPNPFNPVTNINYELRMPSAELVNLSVYNSSGQLVKTLVNGKHKAGMYSVEFDGSNLNSGIYFYKLSTAGKSVTNKMILIK